MVGKHEMADRRGGDPTMADGLTAAKVGLYKPFRCRLCVMKPELDLAAAKLRLALDLFDSGEAIMRQNLRRAHPNETAAQIESRLETWIHSRPQAPHGDGVGRPIPWTPRHPE